MSEEKSTEWFVTGDWLEACGSPPICPAYFLSPFPRGSCEGVATFNITKGKYGDIDISDLKASAAFYTPEGKIITEGLGQWKAIIYIDETANEEQEKALETIFRTVFGVFGQVLNVKRAKINFTKELVGGGPAAKHTIEIPGVFNLEAEPLIDMQGNPTQVVNSPLFGGVINVGKSEVHEFKDSDLKTWNYKDMSVTYFTFRVDSESLMITPISK